MVQAEVPPFFYSPIGRPPPSGKKWCFYDADYKSYSLNVLLSIDSIR